MVRKDFDLTHVVYEDNDIIGYFLALISLSPIFIMVMYITLIVFRREMHTISLTIGQILNEILNQILKKVLNQPRPEHAIRKDAGMPSAHSQFISFFAIYTMLFITKGSYNCRYYEKAIVGIGCHILGILVCCSRVYLGYHSIEQVVVGSTIGILVGIIWFYITEKYFRKMFKAITSYTFCKKLLLRDSTEIPDILYFEYKCIKEATEVNKSE